MSDTPRQIDQSCVYLWLPDGTYDFTIGIREAPDVQPTDGHRRLPIIVPPVLPQ